MSGSDFGSLTESSASAVGEGPRDQTPARRRDRARLIGAAVLGAFVAAFALINLGDVKVHWLVTTGRTPLIVVIAVAFILGMLVDRLVIRARRRRSQ